MLLIAIVVAVVSMLSSAILALGRAAIYDDSPALVVHAVEPVSVLLRRGEPIQYTLVYDKRHDCHPPQGSSEISYRIWFYPKGEPPSFIWADYSRPSRAEPGVNMRLPTPSRIPIPPLAAGEYGFQFRATYNCAKASGPQSIDGPVLKFRVVD